ncbi:MAG: hypothetical protein A2V67_03605 [Deltaproteobacteria bacterium RBG_13_61_14]|nr:MAG: hypothetical protein A2V67_03605 [Deltaproteobacteria bacterium RBG_13_61_14]
MGLFDSPLQQLEDFLALQRASHKVREFPLHAAWDWPEESSLILEEDTALELGHPGLGSLSLLLWTEGAWADGDQVLLLGPDLNEMKTGREPFAQVLLVRGSFADEYECYQKLREAVYDTKLRGLMTRVLPSRQTIWSRVNHEALENGFSLAHLGAALVRRLKEAAFVSGARALFITGSARDIAGLESAGRETARITSAMVKMSEEMSYDCASCEFRDVCEQVPDLRQIREKLLARKRR